MPFNLDEIKGVFKNKYALAGVAVAVGAGGYVLYRRSKVSAGTGSTTPDASTATGVTGVGSGTADTTGNDVATWLGSYSQNLQNTLNQQLSAYGTTLNDALKGITPTTPAPTTTDVGPYPGTPRPTGTTAYVTKAGQGWADVLSALGFSGTSDATALEQWNRTHGTTAVVNGKAQKSNAAASGYQTFGVGTVLAVPTSSPGKL
ncbi:hypothetical protein GCM10009765_65230 [Fodinicola feengrottensis]|uniref:PASTA domain-containing protein n=1 Tax=Fodinicola feengrottensis TaxID=435914 RepID=A0ABN2IKD6_9ACTN